MRLVLDTNTAISDLLWHGTPGKLIDAAHAKTILLCTSDVLLAELRGALTREKFARQLEARGLSATEVFDGYAALATIVVPLSFPRSSNRPSSTIPPTTPCWRARTGRRPNSSSRETSIYSIFRNTKAFGL